MISTHVALHGQGIKVQLPRTSTEVNNSLVIFNLKKEKKSNEDFFFF